MSVLTNQRINYALLTEEKPYLFVAGMLWERHQWLLLKR